MTRRSLLLGCVASALLLLSPAVGEEPARLRVLTYNIHHGEGTDGKFDLPRIAKVIEEAKPDLVALQEVDVKTTRSKGVDQAAELGRLTGLHATFGKAIDVLDGQYGEAVLSRRKPSATKSHPLPFSKGNEARCALEIRFEADDQGPAFSFVGTHLDHTNDPTDRRSQAAALNKLFPAGDKLPTILAGDLNATAKTAEIRTLTSRWIDATASITGGTWPSHKPDRKIDYVLVQPASAWRVVQARVLDEQVASDHRPVLVVLQWK